MLSLTVCILFSLHGMEQSVSKTLLYKTVPAQELEDPLKESEKPDFVNQLQKANELLKKQKALKTLEQSSVRNPIIYAWEEVFQDKNS